MLRTLTSWAVILSRFSSSFTFLFASLNSDLRDSPIGMCLLTISFLFIFLFLLIASFVSGAIGKDELLGLSVGGLDAEDLQLQSSSVRSSTKSLMVVGEIAEPFLQFRRLAVLEISLMRQDFLHRL